MKDAEPWVITNVKNLINSLPIDRWITQNGLSQEESHREIDEQERVFNIAKIVYPVYRYLLDQDFYRVWTRNRIVEESLENGFYDFNNKAVKFPSAIGLLVYKLKDLGVVEPIDENYQDPEDFEFCFIDSDATRAKAHEYCAELALMSGLSDEVVQMHKDDAMFYKRRQEFPGK